LQALLHCPALDFLWLCLEEMDLKVVLLVAVAVEVMGC
jgi:hypothetical protein